MIDEFTAGMTVTLTEDVDYGDEVIAEGTTLVIEEAYPAHQNAGWGFGPGGRVVCVYGHQVREA